MRPWTSPALLGIVPLVMAACGGAGATPTSQPTSTPQPTTAPAPIPKLKVDETWLER